PEFGAWVICACRSSSFLPDLITGIPPNGAACQPRGKCQNCENAISRPMRQTRTARLVARPHETFDAAHISRPHAGGDRSPGGPVPARCRADPDLRVS